MKMNQKINVIDFETGRSVSITVDDEDIVDTLLNKVKNYWVKHGDYVLAYSGEILAPVCLIKDYHIKEEDILQLKARTSLEEGEQKTLAPVRPEGIVYPRKCPNCGPVEFRYISPTDFQCLVCRGILKKQPEYVPADPLDLFLREDESFMDFIPENEEETSAPMEIESRLPPPRIVVSSQDHSEEVTNFMVEGSVRRPPRIIGPPKDDRQKGKGNRAASKRDSIDKEDIPLLEPETSISDFPICGDCSETMRFINLYGMWWCDKCQRYLGEEGNDKEDGKIRLAPRYRDKKDAPSSSRKEKSIKPGDSPNEISKKDAYSDEPSGTSYLKGEDWPARFGKKKESSNDIEEMEKMEEMEELSTIPLTDDDDTEFLVHRGKQWLRVFMKMEKPEMTGSKWVDELLQIEFRDDDAGICILEIDSSGEEIKPLYYRSPSYEKNVFGAEEE